MTDGALFLHELDPRLHTSHHVEAATAMVLIQARSEGQVRREGENIKVEMQKPVNKIGAYLSSIVGHSLIANRERVEGGVEDELADAEARQRQVDIRIVDIETVALAFAKLHQRKTREEGRGNFKVDSKVLKSDWVLEEAERLRSDQRHSLKRWTDYLTTSDSPYPTWFKYYVLDGVLRLGPLDLVKDRYTKRDSTTIAPFVELNTGALSKMYSWLHSGRIERNQVDGEFTEQETEARFQRAIKQGGFAEMYRMALRALEQGEISKELREITDGEWVTFKKGSDPQILFDALQGFGLTWCTATGIETTKWHVGEGDFHVFFTKDTTGVSRIPRVAVRMHSTKVAEVRGIDYGQNLEGIMIDSTLERLSTLHGGKEYYERAQNMKRLTQIDRLLKSNPDYSLNADDLRFIYEFDGNIIGFGQFDDMGGYRQDSDPRIAEILSDRDVLRDLTTIFECDVEMLPYLMVEANPSILARYINNFTAIQEEVAYKMVAAHLDWEVIIDLSRFTGLGNDLAKKLWEANFRQNDIVENLESFTGLGDEIAIAIAKRGNASAVLMHSAVFSSKFSSPIAEILVETNRTSVLADNLGKFKKLPIEIAQALIDAGEEEAVKENRDVFEEFTAEINDQLFAESLSSDYDPDYVAELDEWFRHGDDDADIY